MPATENAAVIDEAPGIGTTLILDSLNDPGNLGTIIRSCDWFNVRNIICSKNTVDIYSKCY